MVKPVIAAFDFDRTITRCESLLPFVVYTHGASATAAKMFYLLPIFVGFIFGLKSRQFVKETIIEHFYKGISREQMETWGNGFAQEKIPAMTKPAAMKRLQWHLDQGHRCILISANLDCYLSPWAKIAGFNDVISSRLEYDFNRLEYNSNGKDSTGIDPIRSDSMRAGNVTGKLQGLNCWGPEKARRLEELVGPKEEYILYAYGDSRGDREILFLADFSYYRKMPTGDSA